MTLRSVLLIASLATASAQTRLAFDAASVKVANPAEGMGSYTKYGEVMGSLQSLIRFAYGLEDYRISGGPKWLDADKFSIIYKPVTPQANLMMRTLLAERFKLAVHTETKELPVYTLVVAKNGPKLEKGTDLTRASSGGSGMIRGTMEMSTFVSYLSSTLGRRVIDKTE
jgi:uncharacterized protein (TIGR03435 family)